MATIGRHKAVGRLAPAAPERIAGMVGVALRSYPVFSRIPQSGSRACPMGLGLFDLQ